MALVKNALLFGGWIPSLLAGATSVWWLTTDKIVEDALKKTEMRFLNTTKDFENVYEQFEGEDSFIKDIPNVEELKGKAIAEWCKDTMEISLATENIKEIITKATKYCMGNGKVVSFSSGFKNFGEVINILDKTTVPKDNIRGLTIVHLGEEDNEDVYYNSNCDSDFKKDCWDIFRNSRKFTLSKRLYIEDKYKILKSDERVRWEEKVKLYESASKEEKFPQLERLEETKLKISKTNILNNECLELLKKRNETKEEYDKAYSLFIKWCVVEE